MDSYGKKNVKTWINSQLGLKTLQPYRGRSLTLETPGSNSYISFFAHLTSTKKKHLLSFTVNIITY